MQTYDVFPSMRKAAREGKVRIDGRVCDVRPARTPLITTGACEHQLSFGLSPCPAIVQQKLKYATTRAHTIC